jgi:hypothetical protein
VLGPEPARALLGEASVAPADGGQQRDMAAAALRPREDSNILGRA